MKKVNRLVSISLALVFSISAFSQTEKLVSKKSHINFFSHTSVEDLQADNYASVSTINTETGVVVFSIPMQSFEFEKSLMQKHFNSNKFLDTKPFPKAKLKATISNLGDIDFAKDGSYTANIEGDLTIKGVTKPIKESGTVTVKNGAVSVDAKFNIVLADYGITFTKGKPSSNIAKEVAVTVKAEY